MSNRVKVPPEALDGPVKILIPKSYEHYRPSRPSFLEVKTEVNRILKSGFLNELAIAATGKPVYPPKTTVKIIMGPQTEKADNIAFLWESFDQAVLNYFHNHRSASLEQVINGVITDNAILKYRSLVKAPAAWALFSHVKTVMAEEKERFNSVSTDDLEEAEQASKAHIEETHRAFLIQRIKEEKRLTEEAETQVAFMINLGNSKEVINQLISRGLSNDDIAVQLGVFPKDSFYSQWINEIQGMRQGREPKDFSKPVDADVNSADYLHNLAVMNIDNPDSDKDVKKSKQLINVDSEEPEPLTADQVKAKAAGLQGTDSEGGLISMPDNSYKRMIQGESLLTDLDKDVMSYFNANPAAGPDDVCKILSAKLTPDGKDLKYRQFMSDQAIWDFHIWGLWKLSKEKRR